MISAIVAVDNNWGIGYNGNLLVNISDDLKRFKSITSGHYVVMGLNTWNSLPKKPLPNRVNIVITPDPHPSSDAFFMDMETAERIIKEDPDSEYFIIGGGSIYKQMLHLCDRVYVTHIYKEHENVDTFFPELSSKDWIATPLSEIKEENNIKYQYYVYDRI